MARVTVLGASGRMGTALIRLIAAGGEHQLVGALCEAGDPALGRDAGQFAGLDPLGVLITDDLSTALAGSDCNDMHFTCSLTKCVALALTTRIAPNARNATTDAVPQTEH